MGEVMSNILAVSLSLVMSGAIAWGQTLPVQNGAFDQDPTTSPGWTLSGGDGAWLSDDSGHAISVTGTPDDTNHWRIGRIAPETDDSLSSPIPRAGARGGRRRHRHFGSVSSAIAILGLPPIEGKFYTTLFVTPSNISPGIAWLRFGQWHMKGSVAFDDVSVIAVQPVHARRNDIELGEGESINGNTYVFHGPIGGDAGNYARPLLSHTCSFNTYRWAFGSGSEVVYRHAIDARHQIRGVVEANVNYHEAGTLVVEVRGDSKEWTGIGTVDDVATKQFDIPASVFPAKEISVRLRGTGENGASFQVDGYTYTAELDGAPVTMSGESRFVAVPSTDPRFDVTVQSLGDARPGGSECGRRTYRQSHPVPSATYRKRHTYGQERVRAHLRFRRIPPGRFRDGRSPLRCDR